MNKIILKLFLVVLITGTYAVGKYFYEHNFGDIKYCYAYWTPHGGYWQDSCHNGKMACRKALKEDKNFGLKVNTDKCYMQEFVDAYCVDNVKTGDFRQDDFSNKKNPVLVNVCTKDITKCKKYEPYSDLNSNCVKKSEVSTRESEGLYLTSDQDLEKIIKNNEKSSGCNKYKAAENQKRAFENLGLNWNKTKKWGAFVDVDGNLRVNKQSCRLIERGSEEYNKYK